VRGGLLAVGAAALCLAALPATGVGATGLDHGASRLTVAPVPAVPSGARLLGPLPPASRLAVDVALRPEHPARLSALALAVSTPGSPQRGRYLTPSKLKALFAPRPGQLSGLRALFAREGLVASVAPDGFSLRVSGPVAGLEKTFSIRLVSYRLAQGRVAFSNTSPATLPSRLAARVEAVIGLSDLARFHPNDAGGPRLAAHDHSSSSSASTGLPVACRAASQAESGGYTADQLAKAYGMNYLWSAGDLGAGTTVGIYELERNSTTDIAAYEACYGIHPTISYKTIDGGAGGSPSGSGEAALDIEDVAGLAPASHIIVYQAPNDATGPYDELQAIVEKPTAHIVTTSWGECEPFLGGSPASIYQAAEAENILYELAAAEGQSWFSAAGDNGSADCGGGGSTGSALSVDDPGSQPLVTSVGGTSLRMTSSGNSETVWNNSTGAGGGGVSSIWPMPGYQIATSTALRVVNANSSGAPCAVTTGYCREVPDISADADPNIGYALYYEGSWGSIGGTSAAAPLWAALSALTQESSRCGGRPLGFLNPSLYRLASGAANYSTYFYDVKAGNNDWAPSGLTGGLYPAGAGYDMASGLGTPRRISSGLCAMLGGLRPGISAISPSSGPVAGGTAVTISGYGLNGVTAVYFGQQAAKFVLHKATTTSAPYVVAISPPGSGTHPVVLHDGPLTSPVSPQTVFTYTS
jgi:subtilase family serine protease